MGLKTWSLHSGEEKYLCLCQDFKPSANKQKGNYKKY